MALWPTWLSYAVSYFFIAIVWANHHYLLRYADEATPRLLWFNFAHLFSMSLLPFSTAWMAVSELAPQPVAFYAAVFFLVNATYLLLIFELIGAGKQVPPRVRRVMYFRSITTLCSFAIAAFVALSYPLVGLGICIACLVVYLRPEPSGDADKHSFGSAVGADLEEAFRGLVCVGGQRKHPQHRLLQGVCRGALADQKGDGM